MFILQPGVLRSILEAMSRAVLEMSSEKCASSEGWHDQWE
jgi:hypothetical protein